MHVDIPCAWVLRITSCFIIGENLICTIRQTVKFSRYTVDHSQRALAIHVQRRKTHLDYNKCHVLVRPCLPGRYHKINIRSQCISDKARQYM